MPWQRHIFTVYKEIIIPQQLAAVYDDLICSPTCLSYHLNEKGTLCPSFHPHQIIPFKILNSTYVRMCVSVFVSMIISLLVLKIYFGGIVAHGCDHSSWKAYVETFLGIKAQPRLQRLSFLFSKLAS